MRQNRLRSALIVGALVITGITAGAGAASAQSCASMPGVGKRVNNHGISEYYEDSRCGDLQAPNRPVQPTPKPNPNPTGVTCRDYPDGQLCGVGIGGPRPPLPGSTWVRLYGSVPTGTVTVGGGGGGGNTGTVIVGDVKTVKETNAE